MDEDVGVLIKYMHSVKPARKFIENFSTILFYF